jgi:NAD(P)-dependent dehydrogenase (short-subunit alcohol dehydrogenase family)
MGKVVIVVGGGAEGGISHAIVETLVTTGNAVAIVDIDGEGARRTAQGLAGEEGVAAPFTCDVTDHDAVDASFEEVQRRLGPAWGLVYCPAWAPQVPPEETDVAGWHKALDVTLSGALWCAQAVFPQMKANGGGRIVNFGSEVSDRPTARIGIGYLAAKGGLRALTRGLAWEWGQYGITVNTVWPLAATRGYSELAKTRTEALQAQIQQNALGRMGDPTDDIAPVVEFLLSDSSRFITGATIPANGGRSMP